jgi:NAD(P)-dependent dehydrogenase (short-subunit alcohol dehydrogenase family)
MTRNLFDLTGRVALVTGGSKGIGLAIARAFAEAGADLVICSRHEDDLKTAAVAIAEGNAAKVAHVVADLSRRADVERLAVEATAAFGKIDILVNNAGSNVPQPIDQIQDEDWDSLLELNLHSCMALTRALVPAMRDRGWGRVINISSILGLVGAGGRSIYTATKSGLIGLTWCNAVDLGPHGVTVNGIAPGPFLTDLPASILSETQRAEFAGRTALGRWGEPRELAGPALLLASDAGSYITGATLVVDGGTLARLF